MACYETRVNPTRRVVAVATSVTFVAALGLGLPACGGGDDSGTPDAARADATTVDARPADAQATPDAVASDCDYTEVGDLTNDDVAPATGAPEATGITLGARAMLCGSFASTHYDGDITVDIDSFTITVPAATDVLVRIRGAGAEAIQFVGVDVYTGALLDQYVGGNEFYGDHGTVALHLAGGTYELQPFALDVAAPAAPIDYVVEITADAPAARCPALASGGYAEATDGATSTGNDVITIPSGAPPALTAAASDAPEPTAITLGTAATRVTGIAAVSSAQDQYADRDTYLVTTGAATNELTVRLDTTVATADVDFLLFEAGSATPVLRAITATRPETRTFSVKLATAYWLLVGAKAASTGLPAPYTATLCPAVY